MQVNKAIQGPFTQMLMGNDFNALQQTLESAIDYSIPDSTIQHQVQKKTSE
jgi:hypothetical protein